MIISNRQYIIKGIKTGIKKAGFTALIEKRVTIPNKGTYLITYYVKFWGQITRYRGKCVNE